jgi:hypothetical protein
MAPVSFLAEAASRGFEAEGIEYSAAAAAAPTGALGDGVRVGTVETVRAPHEHYDVVACFDVVQVEGVGEWRQHRCHTAM